MSASTVSAAIGPELLRHTPPSTLLVAPDRAARSRSASTAPRFSRDSGSLCGEPASSPPPCRHADHLVAMLDGRLIAEGSPAEVVTPELVRPLYEVDAVVIPDPVAGTPVVCPVRRVPAPPSRSSAVRAG